VKDRNRRHYDQLGRIRYKLLRQGHHRPPGGNPRWWRTDRAGPAALVRSSRNMGDGL
jgi:hypothetical protein